MKEILQNSNIAIVGGGRVCKAILEIVVGENFPKQTPTGLRPWHLEVKRGLEVFSE